MRRFVLPALGLAACAAAPSMSAAPAPRPAPTVNIRVLDDEGRPLPGASVQRFGVDGKAGGSIVADRPGDITVPLTGAPRIVKLGISALGRKSEVVFVANAGAPVELDVRLGTYAKLPAQVDDVMVIVLEHRASAGLMDSKPVAGGWSVDPHRGPGTFEFVVADRATEALLADGWMRADSSGRAFVPFDRLHLPPSGRAGGIGGDAASVALTRVLGRVPTALRLGGEPFDAARRDEARSSLARSVEASSGDLRSAAALAYFSVPGKPSGAEARALAEVALAVPPGDLLWSLATVREGASPFGSAAAVLGEPFGGPRARAFVHAQPDADAVGDYLTMAMTQARGTPDVQRAVLAAARAPGLEDALRGIEREDPDRKSAPGKRIADFEVVALDGKKVGPRSFAGRPLLIDLWSTSCGPCIRDAKVLEEAFATYAKGEHPLAILSVTTDEAAEVAAFRKKHPMPWHHAVLDRPRGEAFLASLGLAASFPTYVLVGADGTILDASPALNGAALPAALQRATAAK